MSEWMGRKLCVVVVLQARLHYGLEAESRGDGRSEYLACLEGITQAEFNRFVQSLVEGYTSKQIQPGTTVGAIAAQSIGEPGNDLSLCEEKDNGVGIGIRYTDDFKDFSLCWGCQYASHSRSPSHQRNH